MVGNARMQCLREYRSEILVSIALVPLIIHLVFVPLPSYGSYVVLSGSMEPAIQTGSLVYTHETNDYTKGDIITFSVQDRTVTHRIVGETSEGFITKGEKQPPDSWRISESQIRGEYAFSVPLYGYLLRPLTGPGLALWGMIVGVVILYTAGRELLREKYSEE